MIRLYTDAPLRNPATIHATADQAHYLGTVMRRGIGDRVRLFNGREGEWEARIATLSRGKASLQTETQVRPQRDDGDHWLVFAPLKRDATDLVVQKATELGASVLVPVLTERANTTRINEDRMRAIAIEAAEQSERLTVPLLHPLRKLDDLLADWPRARPLLVALERGDAPPPRPHPGQAGLLVGPEGGLGPSDRRLLAQLPFVAPISLGPRILRAETAAIVGLALLQAPG